MSQSFKYIITAIISSSPRIPAPKWVLFRTAEETEEYAKKNKLMINNAIRNSSNGRINSKHFVDRCFGIM